MGWMAQLELMEGHVVVVVVVVLGVDRMIAHRGGICSRG